MRVYMMTNIIYAACPDIQSMTNLNPKHSIIDQWWGLGLLAPHRDHLQYIHHVHLMQRGQNQGVTQKIFPNGNGTPDAMEWLP